MVDRLAWFVLLYFDGFNAPVPLSQNTYFLFLILISRLMPILCAQKISTWVLTQEAMVYYLTINCMLTWHP